MMPLSILLMPLFEVVCPSQGQLWAHLWDQLYSRVVYHSVNNILTQRLQETSLKKLNNPANICLFKVNNRNTRKRFEICSKLTIKTPEQRQWCRSGIFIINFAHISYLFLMFLLLNLNKQMLARKFYLIYMKLVY